MARICRIDRIRNASLSQSASGKHHVRKSAHPGKEVSDDRRLLILKILDILEILLQTTESVGGHISLLTTAGRRGLKPRLPVSYRRARACPSPCL